MVNKAMYSSASEEWGTPQAFFDRLDKEFKFTLDPCASPENAKCKMYYTKEHDGLRQPWSGRVFLNPPYGRGLGAWMTKALVELQALRCSLVVMLLPARTDTRWFQQAVSKADEIRFVCGRLHFDGAGDNSAPFPSVVVVLRDYPDRETHVSWIGSL